MTTGIFKIKYSKEVQARKASLAGTSFEDRRFFFPLETD